MPRLPSPLRPAPRLSLLTAFCLGWAGMSHAIVLYDTDNASANTTAPTGIYADSGWAFEGKYGGFLGTMIGPQHFITAQHFGLQGSTFVSSAEFNGGSDVTYTIDAAANSGQGFWDIAGTDLRVLKINETFSSYAAVYTGGAEVGSTMVTVGRGGPRGAEVDISGTLHGWYTTGADGVARWGANQVDQVVASGVGNLLAAGFNAIAGQQEATLSSGDSGGGVFIEISGQWYLAGVNYGVDGYFDTNNILGDFSEFDAALFDKGGFYEGSDGTGWNFNTDTALDKPSRLYASRVSDSSAAIASITGVPEPGSLGLVMIAGLLAIRRRRITVSVPQR